MKTGHVKQVATFEELLGYCNAHGVVYNPSKATLKSAALNSLLATAQQSLGAVVDARINFENARNQRNQAFDELPKLMTRIVNTLIASGASRATVADAYGYIRKFRPVAKTKAKTTSTAGADTSPPSATRSTSQLDFDSKAGNFEAFVALISTEPTYQPNEIELQVSTLESKAAAMHQWNTAVLNAMVVLSNAIKQRNQLLYDRDGIHDAAINVKHYVKGVFGFQSVAYHQIRSLKFKRQKGA